MEKSEEAELYKRLANLQEVRNALCKVADGESYGPGEEVMWQIAKAVLIILALCCFLSLLAFSPLLTDIGAWVWVVAIPASLVIMVGAIKALMVWGDRYIATRGSWEEYIASRLSGYIPLDAEGYREVKEKSPDGALDVDLLRAWIDQVEIPAANKRITQLLPRATIRVAE